MGRVRVWLVLLLAGMWGGRAGWGAEPQNAAGAPGGAGGVPTIQATSRTVVLDVVVTGGDGRPVAGLQRRDFSLREDGTPQRIASFSSTVAGRNSAGSGPRTILLVDEMNTRFTDFAYVRYSLRQLMTKEGEGLDHPTALYALSNKGLVVLSGYTLEASVIEAALERRPPALPYMLDQGLDGAVDRINDSLKALDEIAMANIGVPGRKNVIWISPGFPILSPFDVDPRVQAQLFRLIRRLSDELLQARISVYTVDPRGVMGVVSPFSTNQLFGSYLEGVNDAEDAAFGDLAIQTLAMQTGGEAFYGRNDVDREMARSLAEANTYYTLSYTPKDRNFNGKFRKIAVRVDRPGVHVFTREGYYALPDGERDSPEEMAQGVAEALDSPLRFEGLLILNTSTQLSRRPDRAKINIAILSTDLSWRPDARGQMRCRVMVGAMVESKAGRKKAGQVRALEFEGYMPAGIMPNGHTGIAFVLEVPVRYPLVEIRLVVRDTSSRRTGSTEITGLETPTGPAPFTGLQTR
jgi:VWFA-related protein